MTNVLGNYRFSGKVFSASEVALICEVVANCRGLSRTKLANTIRELLRWTRPAGGLKEPECLAVLEGLESSGLLMLPEKHIQSLASAVLSLGARRLRGDWQAQYGVEPLLVETLVDPAQYRGDCYRVANWLELGETAGRGRNDRAHQRHGVSPKRLWVYPLTGRGETLAAGRHLR